MEKEGELELEEKGRGGEGGREGKKKSNQRKENMAERHEAPSDAGGFPEESSATCLP